MTDRLMLGDVDLSKISHAWKRGLKITFSVVSIVKAHGFFVCQGILGHLSSFAPIVTDTQSQPWPCCGILGL